MMIVIDNYDSFVFNLSRYLRELGEETSVVRNDAVSVQQVLDQSPAALLISPGPCGPESAGISVPLVQAAAAARIPTLGVCLGHQAIGVAFGGSIRRANRPMHGKASSIRYRQASLFEGLANPFRAARYHSLVVDLPNHGPLEDLAYADDGELMALKHRDLPIWGVQFHPESVITENGHTLLSNFLTLARETRR